MSRAKHIRGSAEDRFWPKVEKTDTCWNWTAAKSQGYGLLNRASRTGGMISAHRFSYELENGPIPDGLDIDHICHNTVCVNPNHLRAVTNKQNQENRAGADRDSKTGVRGVYWSVRDGTYHASVSHYRKRHFVGHFSTLAEAEAAVIAKRNELFTHNDMDRLPA